VPDISELRVPADDECVALDKSPPQPPPPQLENVHDLSDDIIVEQEVRVRKGRDWFKGCRDWIASKDVGESVESPPHFPNIVEVDEITILSDNEEAEATNVTIVDNTDDDIEIIAEEEKTNENTVVQNESDSEEEMRLQVSDDENEDKVEFMSVEDSKEQNGETLQEEESDNLVLVIKDTDCDGNKETLFQHW
jgi:hypothetical protein